jgi:hypothetical protein
MPPLRQKHERIEIEGELNGEIQIFQPMSVTQISLGGARIATAFPLHLNSLHEFRLALGDVSVVLKGRIVHCRISEVDQEQVTYLAGVEFVEPPEHVRTVLTSFVTKLKDRKARPA